MKIKNIQTFVDAQLVACHVQGIYEAKQETTKRYLAKVKELVECFSRNQNKQADALSKLAALTFEHLGKKVLVDVLSKRSIDEKQVADLIIEEKNILDPDLQQRR